jgi:hypothetical protein
VWIPRGAYSPSVVVERPAERLQKQLAPFVAEAVDDVVGLLRIEVAEEARLLTPPRIVGA